MELDMDFRILIPPISREEHKLLKQSILKDGCRDSIKIWTEPIGGRTMILDGHNRYDICKKNKIQFRKESIPLKNKNEAKVWVIQNQLGRRNLTSYQRGKLTSQLKEMIQVKAKEKQKKGGREKVSQKSDEAPLRTDEELAKMAGVSRDTIRKVEIIEKEAPPKVKEAAEKGEISINKAYKKTRVDKSSEKSLIRDDYFVGELSSYIRSTKYRLDRIIPHLDDIEPDPYNALMALLTDLEKTIRDATFKFYVEQRQREAEEAEKIKEEINPLLEKNEEDLTEEEKAKVDAYMEDVSPYYLHKGKFERCESAWRELSKSQKKQFAERYCKKEVNP